MAANITKETSAEKPTSAPTANSPIDNLASHFAGTNFEKFGTYKSAFNYKSTFKKVLEAAGEQFNRPDEDPPAVLPWELRLGGAKFMVPPININVSQTFMSGSLGGALRQPATPKFNSGHSQTLIELTLYFPTHANIWGFRDKDRFNIDFDKGSKEDIDFYIASLRGLVAAFRYTPILPVRNQYLNQVHGITAVGLKNINISTLANFPYCIVVSLTLIKFNHQIFLPMVGDFNNAIHWGRYRQYMGRAASKLNEIASKDFLHTAPPGFDYTPTANPLTSAKQVLGERDRLETQFGQPVVFDKKGDIDGKDLDFYYPFQDPVGLVVDDRTTDEFKKTNDLSKKANLWQGLIEGLTGLNVDEQPQHGSTYDSASDKASKLKKYYNPNRQPIIDYLAANHLLVKQMTSVWLDKYIASVLDRYPYNTWGPKKKEELIQDIREVWWALAFEQFFADPKIAAALERQKLKNDAIFISEWEVPMQKLNLDPTRIFVQSISVNASNTFVPLAIQMQDDPTLQHVGAGDTICEISLIAIGEDELTKVKQMFDTINGLARLEHNHGVLGFIGVKNLLTALVGFKYAIPSSFEVDTIPNYPHAYNVRISLMDFDVFQSRREQLSLDQQAELIEAFGKANPFLRIKQLWGAFSAYPDFPLGIRDSTGRVVGHLDPDFYFRAWEAIADDFEQPEDPQIAKSESPADQILNVYTGPHGGADHSYISMNKDNLKFINGKQQVDSVAFNEPLVSSEVTEAQVEGFSPPSNHLHAYIDKSGNPMVNGQSMAKDEKYRNKDGRMIKAFPTYMLWFVQEEGNLAGVKLYDNFYGLQSVIDLSIVRSEDVLGDTLVLRLSNLYSRLNKDSQFLLDDGVYQDGKEVRPGAQVFNTMITRELNTVSGTTNLLVKLESVNIKPGGRVHLRLGYSSDPNSLETVFNGVITSVQAGEVMEIVCQSDAVELGALVNTHNAKTDSGSSGRIDGSFMGFWLSQPRDLMVNLLTMGSSTAKQAISNMRRGKVFSENKFGIKHFGMMLYPPLTTAEKAQEAKKKDYLSSHMTTKDDSVGGKLTGLNGIGRIIGGVLGMYDTSIVAISQQLWMDYSIKPDYEIFCRNIYPGNGTGIAQFLGGDIGDFGLNKALAATGVNPDGTTNPGVSDAVNGVPADSKAAKEQEDAAAAGVSFKEDIRRGGSGAAGGVGSKLSTLSEQIGLTKRTISDDGPVDEICFRAQTYMKTVWDMFLVCAALLPNYIVAVRPFEHRSTVFYGKPHWAYTSGVIPVTTGPSDYGTAIEIADPDQEYAEIFKQINQAIIDRDNKDPFEDAMAKSYKDAVKSATGGTGGTNDPLGTVSGIKYDASQNDPKALPKTHPDGGYLLNSSGPVVMEMHLGTSLDLSTDISQHHQLAELPAEIRHPFYMDRVGGGRGGVDKIQKASSGAKTVLQHDDPSVSGASGAFGFLSPIEEQWYCNQYWAKSAGYTGSVKALRGKRILVFNPQTGIAVVCTPGDVGPFDKSKTGISPDTNWALGGPSGSVSCYFGFVRDDAPLGPYQGELKDIVLGSGGVIPGQKTPASNAAYKEKPGQWDWLEPGKDANDYSVHHGYIPGGGYNGKEIPVNFDRDPGDPSYEHDLGLKTVDKVGSQAEAIYKEHKDNSSANEIWEQFRSGFGSYSPNKKTWDEFLDAKYDTITAAMTPGASQKPTGDKKDKAYHAMVERFIRTMWEDPYRRGWIVLTADRKGTTAGFMGSAPLVGGALHDATHGIDNAAGAIGIGSGNADKWNFDHAEQAFREFVAAEGDVAVVDAWVRDPNHAKPGSNTEDPLQHQLTDWKHKFLDPVLDFLGAVAGFALGTIGTIISTLRLSMLQLTNGLSMVSQMQKRTNVLSDMLNDSMYFQGDPSSLAYLVDNPFTREFNEPVVEVREPFQRSHFISSFQNIISNNIIENKEGVATVVTAISNGNYPHTVFFDKGAPAEYQIEKVVETGLITDSPHGVWANFKAGLTSPFNFGPQRRFKKIASGAPDELSVKRVALYHLKESLKDIYGGEILIVGDPTMRPHDLLYINDIYSKIYGLCEIEQVVHHFTPDTGFVTSITPNALVSVDDPGRFYISAMRDATRQRTAVRQHLQHSLKAQADKSGMVSLGGSSYTPEQLANRVASTMEGSTQYIGGVTSVIKGFAAMSAAGALEGNIPLAAAAGAGAFLTWKAWGWTRDHLLDQHDVIIQYLRKNGQPMDAGLVMNQGVAVGQQHGLALLMGGINIGRLSTKVGGAGHISTEELLGNLGWKEKSISELYTTTSSYIDEQNQKILEASGRAPDRNLGMQNKVVWVHIDRVIDGDTFVATAIDGSTDVFSGSQQHIRLMAVDAYEDPFKDNPDERMFHLDHLGVQASLYSQAKIWKKEVAIRIVPGHEKDKFFDPLTGNDGRALGFVFCNAPSGLTDEERKAYLVNAAGGFPIVDWQSYNEEGQPYTLDQELLQKGYAKSSAPLLLRYQTPDSGVK